MRIAPDRRERIAQTTEHFVEDHDVEVLLRRVLLAIRGEEGTAFILLLLRRRDGGARHVNPDIVRIAITRKSVQQNTLATSGVQHGPARL